MSERPKIISESNAEDMNDSSIIFLSPIKTTNNATATTASSNSKYTFLSFPDLNNCSFPQEIEYMEYLQPFGGVKRDLCQENAFSSLLNGNIGEFDDTPLPPFCKEQYNPSFIQDDYNPNAFVPNNYQEESATCQKVVQITTERKTSIVTAVYDSSVDESVNQPSCKLGVRKETICSHTIQPQFHSVKMSIGAFNSVDQVKDFPSLSKVGKPYSTKCAINLGRVEDKSGKHCCNCKKSRCLKLYCECFANGSHCKGCSCSNCFNIPEHEEDIQNAKRTVSEKNPVAFKKRIGDEAEGKQAVSCNCSKSGCLKKYCECYKNGQKCGSSCNCLTCKNTAALRTISYKRYEKNTKKTKKVTLQHLA